MQANDKLQIALIGAGGMGSGDVNDALLVPGVKLVAVCDLYDGRLDRARERWGKDIATTRDYRQVLARKDVDAVIIGTSDNWHSRISIDAMEAGKDVYCEKPMVQHIDQGHEVIASWKKTGRIFQVGSQYASSIAYLKARDLLAQGAIGKVNMVEAWLDRNSAIGAWQYSIPPDASPQTVDWDRYLGGLPKRPFDALQFFRWRNYRDFGTGLAGDLYVHLLTGLHVATGAKGPSRVYATGGIRFWKDGRDVPDVMLGLMDYPEFTFSLRVNFASGQAGEQFGVRFIGSEGTMMTTMRDVTISRHPRETEPGVSIGTFSQAMQERYMSEYRQKYPVQIATADAMRPDRDEHFIAPSNHDPHRDHMRNFITAVRTRKAHFEDAEFGLRTAGPALLTNASYYEGKPIGWNPDTLKRA